MPDRRRKSTSFRRHEKHRFYIDSMSVCYLGLEFGLEVIIILQIFVSFFMNVGVVVGVRLSLSFID